MASFSPISTTSTGGGRARPPPLRLLRAFWPDPQVYATRLRWDGPNRANRRWSINWSNCAATTASCWAAKPAGEDEFFYAEQNARLVKNAENYYDRCFAPRRIMELARPAYAETLAALLGHFDGGQSKMVVWAHNSHLGDAVPRDEPPREWNLGQLVRERLVAAPLRSVLAPIPERLRPREIGALRPSAATSGRPWRAATRRCFTPARHRSSGLICADNDATKVLRQPRLQRAIGVIYRPESERLSHYFEACSRSIRRSDSL